MKWRSRIGCRTKRSDLECVTAIICILLMGQGWIGREKGYLNFYIKLFTTSTHLDFTQLSCWFHSGGDVDRVAPNVILGLLGSHHSRHHGALFAYFSSNIYSEKSEVKWQKSVLVKKGSISGLRISMPDWVLRGAGIAGSYQDLSAPRSSSVGCRSRPGWSRTAVLRGSWKRERKINFLVQYPLLCLPHPPGGECQCNVCVATE